MTDLEARFLKASTDERDAEEDRKAKVARRLKFLSIGATAAAIIAMWAVHDIERVPVLPEAVAVSKTGR